MTLIDNSSFKLPIFTSKEKFEINDDLLDYIINLDHHQQMVGGNTSSVNSYVLDLPQFKELKKFIQKQLDEYFHEICQIKDNVEIYITQSWINYNTPFTKHHKHRHQNSVVSGSFYIQGSNNTPIAFERESIFGSGLDLPTKSVNEYNSTRFLLNNELHKLTLFPSNLHHDVEPNMNMNTRISMAFNTYLKGIIGDNQNKTELKL